MFSVKRPSAKDTEEDLLKLQEEFLKEKSEPAAAIANKTNVTSEKTASESSHNSAENIADEIDAPSKPVVFDIKERNIISPKMNLPCRKKDPFPTVSRRNTAVKSVKGNKSIFAQQMEKMKVKNMKTTTSTSTPAVKLLDCPVIIDGSGLGNAAGEDEAKKIHEENVSKLSSLTENEILTEQSLLLEKLDPKLIDFVRKKRQSKLVKDPKTHGSRASNLPKENDFKKSVSQRTSIQNSRSTFSTPGKFSASFASFDEPSEDSRILKMSKGHDHDGIILENMPEEITIVPHTGNNTASHAEERNLQSNTANDIELHEEELPVSLKDAGKWLHMDKIEKGKLQWMTLLPKPKPIDLKSGHTARFDFQGELLLTDRDVPTQKGLHHHAEEPELPGYSVEELFLLSRSSNQSQRVTALQTLAHIMKNNWLGRYDGCFERPLLMDLLNAGIVPLLRWALDDATDTSVAAATSAIHHLLVCTTDENCLDLTFPWTNGHLSPFIKPYDVEQVPEASLKELTDATIIKLDVIKGFLRMDILTRLRYILLVMCPSLSVCEVILKILVRFARHSNESAKKVAECPYLIESIFKKFLPAKWSVISYDDENKTDSFVCPVACAVKLVRVISASSIKLASHLLSKYHLEAALSCYLSIGLSDEKLSVVATQKLMLETLRTWRTLLTYGFCTNVYVDSFPVLIRQLQYFITVSITENSSVHAADYMYAAVFYKALEAVVTVAADHDKVVSSSCDSTLPVFSVAWNHVTGLLPLAESCLQRWLHEFSRGGTSAGGSILLACCMDFYSVYCTKAKEQLDLESDEAKNRMQNVVTAYLVPFLQSVSFRSYLDNLRSFSVLLYSGLPGSKRNTSTLTSLESTLWQDDIVPILKEGTPFPIATSVTELVIAFSGLLPSFDETATKAIILHPSVIKYLKQVTAKSKHFNHWFDRYEIALIYQLIKLASLKVCGDPAMWHKLSISLLPNIRTSDEWVIKYLMENIIFNKAFLLYNDGRFMGLNQEEESAGDNITLVSKEKLWNSCQAYVNFFLSTSSIKKSRQKWLKTTYDWVTSIEDNQKSTIPHDWPYKPFLVLYQQLKNGISSSPELVTEVTAFLEWVYLLQHLQLPTFKHVSRADIFCHVSVVFILGSDLFFNERIKEILQSLLCLLTQHEKLDLTSIQWNENSTYDDLFSEMVVQFEAESYGDPVFGNYLLVAFQQCYPSRWKKLVFSEYPQAVRIMKTSLSNLVVPLTNYLEPKETDTGLLTMYFKTLSSGLLVPERSPLLYLMAVHHLHHYLFMTSEHDPKFQKILLNSLMRCRKKDVTCHVLLYKAENEHLSPAFEVAGSLIDENKLHLSNINGMPITFENGICSSL